MRRAARRAVAAVAVAALLPAGGAAADPASRLDAARTDLGTAERELADVERELTTARTRLSDVDARLAAASQELVDVRDALRAAEAALEAASRRERRATATLVARTAALRGHVEAWADHRAELEARVADAYKHGRADDGSLLLEGIATSSDLHRVSVTVRTVEELVARDRRLVEEDETLALEAADARRAVAEVRATAVREQRAVAREQRRIAALVRRQQQTVLAIAEEQADRRALVAHIEADRAAKALLVRDLREQVRSLTAALDAALLDAPIDLPVDGPMPDWAAGLPAHGRVWAPAIASAAASVGLDGRLLAALVWTESSFHPRAVSHAGAIGLAQLMPGTARGLGVDPHDPLQNLVGGARYLRAQIATFGRVDLALAAYNAGPGRVQRAGGIPDIVETQLYVLRVLERYERLLG